jgi:hypothetical protein
MIYHSKFRDKTIAVSFWISFLPAVLIMFRNSYWSWRTIWAEDGTIFFAQARNMPILEFLTTTYNGSYILLTRILFLATEFLPIQFLSYYTAGISFLTYFFILFLIDSTIKHDFSLNARLLLAFGLALIPIAGAESLQNVNNLPWFWVIGWSVYTCYGKKSVNKKQLLFYRIITVLMSFSSPIMFLLVIFTLFFKNSLNYFKDIFKNGFGRLFFIVVILSGIIQNLIAFRVRLHSIADLNLVLSAIDAAYRLILIPITGNLMYDQLNYVSTRKVLSFVISLLVFIAIAHLLSLLWKNRLRLSENVGKAFQIALILFTVSVSGVYVQLSDFSHYYFSFALANARYFVTAGYAVLFLIISFHDKKDTSKSIWVNKFLFILIYVISCTVNFANNPSKFGPDHIFEVNSAKHKCTTQDVDSVDIFVAPPNGEWKFKVPCKDLI